MSEFYKATGERVGAVAGKYAATAAARDGARDEFERELAAAFVAGVRYAARELDERELSDVARTRRK